MAKIAEKTAATKSRETKLSKKSNEELIQIILRKDKTEKNMTSQIINLKGEVNSLNSRLTSSSKDMDGTIKEIKNLRDSNKTKQETIDNIRIQLIEAKEAYEKENKSLVELKSKYEDIKTLLWTTIGALVITMLIILFC